MVTNPNHLNALVHRLIDDPSTSTAIRNECHRLLIAMDSNHQLLIEEGLMRLTQLLDAVKVNPPQ